MWNLKECVLQYIMPNILLFQLPPPFEPNLADLSRSSIQCLMEFPNGNKTIALTPNMKFNPYIFCSRDTDKLKIKKISKPPIIVAFAWSMSLSSINSIGYSYSELLRSITISITEDRYLSYIFDQSIQICSDYYISNNSESTVDVLV